MPCLTFVMMYAMMMMNKMKMYDIYSMNFDSVNSVNSE